MKSIINRFYRFFFRFRKPCSGFRRCRQSSTPKNVSTFHSSQFDWFYVLFTVLKILRFMYLVCFRRGCKYKAPAWVDFGRLEFWTRIILLLCHLKASLLSKYFSEIIQFSTFSTLWLPSLSHEKVNLVKDPGKKRQTNHMCIFIQTLGEKTLEKNIHGKKETDRQTKRACISIQTVVPPLYLIFQNCKIK